MKFLVCIVTIFLVTINFQAQTKQQLLSKDLLNAVIANKNGDYVTSINFLDKCQKVLGKEVVPRIEELYIINYDSLNNPIQLNKHLNLFFACASKQRKGYKEKQAKKESIEPSLQKLYKELKEEFKLPMKSHMYVNGVDGNLGNKFDFREAFLLKEKKEFFSQDIKWVVKFTGKFSSLQFSNIYFYDRVNDTIFSRVGKHVTSFSSGLARVDKTFINKKGEVVVDASIYDYATIFHNNISYVMKSKQGWGVINKQGKLIIPTNYDDIIAIPAHNLIKVYKNDKYGFFDFKGNQITEIIYDTDMINTRSLDFFIDKKYPSNLIPVKLNGTYGYINAKGNKIIDHKFKEASLFNNNCAKVNVKNKYGVINKQGQFIIPAVYEQITFLDDYIMTNKLNKNDKYEAVFRDYNSNILLEGYNSIFYKERIKQNPKEKGLTSWLSVFSYEYPKDSILLERRNKYYYLNLESLELKPTNFQNIEILKSGLLKIKHKDKYGIYSYQGKKIIENVYDQIHYVDNKDLKTEDYFIIYEKNSNKGIIDITNQFVPIDYDIYCILNYNLLVVKDQEKLGMVDVTNKIVYPFDLEDVNKINDSICRIKKDGKFGLMNYLTFKEILPNEYDKLEFLQDELLKVQKGEFCGIIDARGQTVVPVDKSKIEKIYSYYKKKNFYKVYKQDKIGLFSPENNFLTAIVYDEIKDDHKKFTFKKGNKKGYINVNGIEYLESNYEIVFPISENYFVAKNDTKKYGLIDKYEKIIIPFNFEHIVNVKGREKVFSVLKSGKKGVLNTEGRFHIPIIYDLFYDLGDEKFIVGYNGNVGLINLENKILIPLAYQKIQPTQNKGEYKVKTIDGIWEVYKI